MTRKIQVVVGSIIFALAILGCGQGGNAETNDGRTEIQRSGNLAMKSQLTRHLGDGICTHGLVNFSSKFKQIEIVSTCYGKKNGPRISFVVQRYHSGKPLHPVDMFGDFTKRLNIVPGSAVLRSGRCTARQELACWAAVRGRVRAVERVSVGEYDVCKDVIVVVALRSVGLNLLGHRLFSGRPRNC